MDKSISWYCLANSPDFITNATLLGTSLSAAVFWVPRLLDLIFITFKNVIFVKRSRKHLCVLEAEDMALSRAVHTF